jgi:hypothetical protein
MLLKVKMEQVLTSCASQKNNPASSGFELVKIPTVEISTVPNSDKSKNQHAYSLERIFFL